MCFRTESRDNILQNRDSPSSRDQKKTAVWKGQAFKRVERFWAAEEPGNQKDWRGKKKTEKGQTSFWQSQSGSQIFFELHKLQRKQN